MTAIRKHLNDKINMMSVENELLLGNSWLRKVITYTNPMVIGVGV